MASSSSLSLSQQLDVLGFHGPHFSSQQLDSLGSLRNVPSDQNTQDGLMSPLTPGPTALPSPDQIRKFVDNLRAHQLAGGVVPEVAISDSGSEAVTAQLSMQRVSFVDDQYMSSEEPNPDDRSSDLASGSGSGQRSRALARKHAASDDRALSSRRKNIGFASRQHASSSSSRHKTRKS